MRSTTLNVSGIASSNERSLTDARCSPRSCRHHLYTALSKYFSGLRVAHSAAPNENQVDVDCVGSRRVSAKCVVQHSVFRVQLNPAWLSPRFSASPNVLFVSFESSSEHFQVSCFIRVGLDVVERRRSSQYPYEFLKSILLTQTHLSSTLSMGIVNFSKSIKFCATWRMKLWLFGRMGKLKGFEQHIFCRFPTRLWHCRYLVPGSMSQLTRITFSHFISERELNDYHMICAQHLKCLIGFWLEIIWHREVLDVGGKYVRFGESYNH